MISFAPASRSLRLDVLATAAALLLVCAGAAEAQPKLTRAPVLKQFVQAPFPESEKGRGAGADVELQLVVGVDGHVEEATVVRSAGPAFDAAALAAVRAFVFEPAEIDGKPGRIKILYRYQFVWRAEVPVTARLRGLVRQSGSRRPLAGIAVSVEGAGSATTDAAGRFTIDDVAPGRRKVTLSGPRLAPTRLEEQLEAGREIDATYDVSLADPEPEGGPADDMEIVVSAPPVRRQAVSTEVSAADARRLPGTQGDVLRVVENMPGVARSAAGSGALVVWGAAPEDTRVFVDGVPIPRLYHDGGLRSVLPSDFVSAVELAPGGYGAPYGGGLGGLVTVTTRTLEGPGVHGALGLDLYDASASVRAALGDRVHVALGLRRSHVDSALSLVDSRAGEFFPIPHYWDGQARIAVRLGAGESLELTGLGSLDELSRGRDSADPLRAARETRAVSFYRGSLRYRSQLDGGALVTVTPFAGFDRDALTINLGGTTADASSETLVFGVRASWRSRIASWLTLEAGLDSQVRRADVTRHGSIALPAREGDVRVFGQPPPGTLTADRWRAITANVAPYLEGDVALADGALHIVPGLRLDPYVRSASRKTPAVGETPEIGLYDQQLELEPRLALRWSPIARLTLKAAGGLYHQQPAAVDLGAVFGSPTLPAAAGTQLLAGGAIAATSTLSVEVTGFYTTSSSLAVRSPLPSPVLAAALTPTGEGRAFGVQLLLRQQAVKLPGGELFGWIGYTFSRSERRDGPGAAWRPFDYDQSHVLTAVFAWTLPLGFEVGLRARVATGYPRTAVLGASFDAATDLYQPIFGVHNGERIPLFFQLDARIAKRFRLRGTELELYLDVQNATNRGNAEEIVYTHDYAQKGYITGLPVLPVLGARWTF